MSPRPHMDIEEEEPTPNVERSEPSPETPTISSGCSASPLEEDLASARPEDDWVEDQGDGARRVCCQSLVPLLIGGLGSISAGLILNLATKFALIQSISQFVAVVPPIQGMKGNLDMTFTSRLTTIAAKGLLDKGQGRKELIFRNVALLAAQGIAFSQFVTLVSFLMDFPQRRPLGCAYNVYFFLGSVSIMAIATSCCVMTFVMVGLVLLARRYKLNPDNMATPFASSLGDLASLGLMLSFCYALFPLAQQHIYTSYIVITAFLLLVPLLYWAALKDKEASAAAKSQWATLLCASVLTSGAGHLLELAHEKFPDITAYQPLISGIAGNRAALMATRLSTILKIHHSSYLPFSTRLNPFAYYITANSKETRTARMLLLTSTFFQLFFVLISHVIASQYEPLLLTTGMLLGYLVAAFIQVLILLFISQLVVIILWRLGVDPDTHAIPIVTAVGDLMGISLLIGLFYTLETISPNSIRVGTVTDNSTTIEDVSAVFSQCIITS